MRNRDVDGLKVYDPNSTRSENFNSDSGQILVSKVKIAKNERINFFFVQLRISTGNFERMCL